MEQEEQLLRDRALCQSIAEGDETAFRSLFHHYTPRLYPVVFKITKTESATHDIIQDTFLRVWLNRDKLPDITYPWLWVQKIAYYQALNFLRSKALHRDALDKMAAKSAATDNMEDTLSFKAVEKCIRQAVEELPQQQKKVYQLSREKGYKVAEIAKTMNLSEQSVKNTMGRALKFIRSQLEKAGYASFIIFWLMYLNNRY